MNPPRWFPRTEDELRAAVADGSLCERHYCDLKAGLHPGDKGNRGLAIDLAAFAVDSGLIILGVDERSSPPALVPLPLTGLKERVDQVARSRPDPPIEVTVFEIAAAGRPGHGYLAIVVPPSRAAPHMVDSRYRGRSDTTNTVLSDAEVSRIRTLRREAQASVRDLVYAEFARDPVPSARREYAHLFVVAQPVFGNPEMLHHAVGETWREWIHTAIRESPRLDQEWGPDIHAATRLERRPGGWAATTLGTGRTVGDPPNESRLLDIEIREDGGLRLFCGRATDYLGRTAQDRTRVVLEVLIAGLTWRMVRSAAVIGETAGYLGNWDFGLGLTRLVGAVSYLVAKTWTADPIPYSDDEYIATTSATFAEIGDDPTAIVDRLFGQLNRALNDGRYVLPRPA